MKEIESKLLSIKEIFSKDKDNNHPLFIVPEYQRPYSWYYSDKCDLLWQDINNMPTAKSHFLGSVIIDKSDFKTLKLVDGQQRITTFILLLKALVLCLNDKIENLKNLSDPDLSRIRSKLEKRRDTIIGCLYVVNDDDIFELNEGIKNLDNYQIKYKNNSMNEMLKDELEKILLENSFESAKNAVYKHKYKKGDNKYSNFFRNFQFFYKKFDEVESMMLSVFADRILESCQAVIITSYDTEQAIEIFNSLNSKMLPLTDANILSAKLYEYTESVNQEEFKIQWENLRESVDANDDKMSEILNQYMYILRAKDKIESTTLPSVRSFFTNKEKGLLNNSFKFVKALQLIVKLGNPNSDNILFNLQKLCLKFNSNFSLFFIPYLYIKETDSDDLKIKYANVLLKLFALLEIVETGYSSSKFKAKLFKINATLATRTTEEIIDDIYAHIGKEFNKEEIKDCLLNDSVKNPIVYLNESLFAISKNIPISFIVKKDVNIEHIMPKSGAYKEIIRKDAEMEDYEEFDKFVNLIGNRILLEENINKSIGRNWFATKKQLTIESKSGYKQSEFPIAASLVMYSKDEWKKSDIEHATKNAAERIADFIFNHENIIK